MKHDSFYPLLTIAGTCTALLCGLSFGMSYENLEMRKVLKESPTPAELKKDIDDTKGAYLSIGYFAGKTLEECREIKKPTPEIIKGCTWARTELAHQMKGTGVNQLGEIHVEQ